MLEYHAHIGVLQQVRASLATTFAGNLALKAKVDALGAAVDAEPDAATLGGIIDLVLDHAASDGVELQLLEQAASLWRQGLALYDQLTGIRAGLEASLLDPSSPDAVDKANAAVGQLGALRASALVLNADAQALHAAIDPLPHLTAHPRQSDIPSKHWGWRDAFLGRRTEAFVEQLFHAARTERARAFAFGALGCYSGNVVGSAYLGAVVGGPRRAHRYRDRLARNTVGAWLQTQLGAPDCGALARHIGFRPMGLGYAIPADILASLQHAATAAWPSRSAPDWDLGLQRAVRHLELLQVFRRPDLPVPPAPELAQGGDVTGTLNFLSGQDYNVPTGTIDTDGSTSGQVGTVSSSDSKTSSGGACLAILLILITIGIALLIYCIGQWTTGKTCDPADFFNTLQGSEAPDPRDPNTVTQQQLLSMADPTAAAHISQELFSLQMMLWQGFDASAAFLAVTGLIYPDDLLLASPLYQQFLATPVRAVWPHREDPGAIDTYQSDPVSAVEQPNVEPPFGAYETPWAFAGPWSPQAQRSGVTVAHRVLAQILSGAREEQNLDLDADRGFRHPCWELAAGASIQDPVLTVEVLPYGAE